MALPGAGRWWRHAGIALAAAVLVGVIWAGWAALHRRPAGVKVVLTGRTMGTTYQLALHGPLPAAAAEDLQREAQAQLDRVEALMSTYRPDSELSRVNAAEPGVWVAVSREALEVVEQALDIGRRSGGGYDITIGPLVNLWGFGPEPRRDRAPAPDAIVRAREAVGLGRLDLRRHPPALRKRAAGMFLDLSSIAKGHAVDQVARALERRGVADYCMEVGGEVRLAGRHPEGGPWRIGVESPVVHERRLERVLHLRGGAVATSGDYRNHFDQDGTRYSHLLDPRTGYPITHALVSTTVLHASCATADAWATALLIAGPEQGLALAQRENLAALFIIHTPDGLVEQATRGFMAQTEGR